LLLFGGAETPKLISFKKEERNEKKIVFLQPFNLGKIHLE
jgi:hypothetical protein